MKAYSADAVFDGSRMIVPGSVIVEDGVVQDVAPKLITGPQSEYLGKYITPASIDAHTHCGLSREGLPIEESDVNEFSDPLTPHLLARDSLDPMDPAFARALDGGVATVTALPGSSNVLGGQGCLVRITAAGVGEVIDDKSCLKCAISKFFYAKRQKAPGTRMAVYAMLRQAFGDQNLKDRMPRAGKEAIERVLKSEIPMRVHLMTAAEILATIRLSEELNIRVILDHATEAHLVAGEIASRGIPVVYGPLFVPRDSSGRKWRKAEVAALLVKRGVRLALMTDHPVIPVEYLRLSAGLLIREGLSDAEALSAITSTPADILGIPFGRITPGCPADVVGWNGEPWQPSARPIRIVRGSHETGTRWSPEGGRKTWGLS